MNRWERNHPSPDDQWIGRLVENAFGTEETVQLLARHWKHFDWLASRGVDMDLWTKMADIDRHGPDDLTDLSGELQMSLLFDEKRRCLAGLECPLFIRPDGYDAEIQPEDIPERLETDLEWFGRTLTYHLIEKVALNMQGKHWRYFDWLIEHAGSMDDFVAECANKAKDSGRSLSQELMHYLRIHEKDNFLNGNNFHGLKIPLYITPTGHSRGMPRRRPGDGIERTFKNSKGEEVSIPMPKQHWRYFDWLAKKGIDMKQWVKDADVSRHSKGVSISLHCELIRTLEKDEKRRFKSDQKSPLFINPDGYDL